MRQAERVIGYTLKEGGFIYPVVGDTIPSTIFAIFLEDGTVMDPFLTRHRDAYFDQLRAARQATEADGSGI